jgi:antitoxin (DNA-binding transcriptional repressor) of toxin-antitoxin stability system
MVHPERGMDSEHRQRPRGENHLSRLIERACAGEEIVIARNKSRS